MSYYWSEGVQTIDAKYGHIRNNATSLLAVAVIMTGMKNFNYTNLRDVVQGWTMYALLVVTGALVGCFKDNTSGCKYTVPSGVVITTHVASTIGVDRLVDEAKMYIFDQKSQLFLASRDISAEEILNRTPITIDYPDRDSVILVVWGNTAPVNQVLQEPKVGDHLDDLRLRLEMLDNGLSYEPTDIFHGIATVAAHAPLPGDVGAGTRAGEVRMGEDLIFMELTRKVSILKISIEKDEYWDNNNYDPSQFRVEVRNVCAGLDFRGNPLMKEVTTIVATGMYDDGKTVSTNIVVLPSAENSVIVVVDQKGDTVVEIVNDKNGNDIVIDEGDKEIEVEVVNKYGEFEVTVTISDWNYVDQDVDLGQPEDLVD